MKTRIFLCIAAVLISAISLSAANRRAEAVAGKFYPADSAELAQLVKQHFDEVGEPEEIDGQILALVVPHAGLVYSGGVAAHAYKLLQGSPVKNVIVCAPSHHFPFEGLSVYGPNIAWTTPLGTVDCNSRIGMKMLRFSKTFSFSREPHAEEHSIEVQLPYLKTILDDFELVPVAMGYQKQENINTLADFLKSLDFDSTTIMVTATDWQHYRPATAGWPMDSLGIDCLKNLNADSLQYYLDKRKVEACGGGPLIAVLKAAIAKGADKVRILKYADSGDKSGDKSSVVGYLAAVIYKSNHSGDIKNGSDFKPAGEANLPDKYELTDNEKKELLKIARESINGYLRTGAIPEFSISEKLKKPGAGFVTLEKNGQLRGCIGYTSAIEPLYKTVSDCAVKAAVADRRFPPVIADEMNNIHIEISVLTPLQKVMSVDEIEVGRDGLMIVKGASRGLLLPQVATDYNWDRKKFLEQTCQKAGLPFEAYKDSNTEIFKFQAVIFEE